MPRLIWVFAERTVTLLVLSCRGSFDHDGKCAHESKFRFLESQHAWQKKQIDLCVQQRLISALAPAQSDQCLRLMLYGCKPFSSGLSLGDWEDRSNWTDAQTMLIWVFAGRTGHFVCFVMLWLTDIFYNFDCRTKFESLFRCIKCK